MPQKGVLKGLTNKVFEQHMHGCEKSKKMVDWEPNSDYQLCISS